MVINNKNDSYLNIKHRLYDDNKTHFYMKIIINLKTTTNIARALWIWSTRESDSVEIMLISPL